MAANLTIRLVQDHPDNRKNIACLPFIAALRAIDGGWHTQAQIENFFNMTAGDKAAFQLLLDEIADVNLATRQARIDRIQDIIALNEADITGYIDADDIETHLLAVSDGP